MGQIVGGSAKTKRCNLNKLSQLGTPAAGEHILVSSDNSMNAAGQGNFDCYVVGDGNTAATALELKYLDDSTHPYIVEEVNKAVADIQPIEITGDVTNAPDEEDLTSENQGGTDVLKFKDKAYNAALYSGLGRVYLRKNIITLEGTGKNVLTQAMVNTANTIYHIQYDYDLNGQTITLPAGCTFIFDGGSFTNGTLVLLNTRLSGNVRLSVVLDGTIANDTVQSDWFLDDSSFFNTLNSLDGYNTISFETKDFYQNVAVTLKPSTITIKGNNATIHSQITSGVLIKNTVLDYASRREVLTAETNNHVVYVSDADGISIGDTLILQDATNYSWSSYRTYYNQGEYLTVNKITEDTGNNRYAIETIENIVGVYDTVNHAGSIYLYKADYGVVSINNLNIISEGTATASIAALVIYTSKDVFVSNVKIDGFHYGIDLFGIFKGTVENCCIANKNYRYNDNYGINIANSQNILLRRNTTDGMNHGIAIGGLDNWYSIVNRYIYHEDCVGTMTEYGNASFDCHGNSEYIYWRNCRGIGISCCGAKSYIEGCILYPYMSSLANYNDRYGITFRAERKDLNVSVKNCIVHGNLFNTSTSDVLPNDYKNGEIVIEGNRIHSYNDGENNILTLAYTDMANVSFTFRNNIISKDLASPANIFKNLLSVGNIQGNGCPSLVDISDNKFENTAVNFLSYATNAFIIKNVFKNYKLNVYQSQNSLLEVRDNIFIANENIDNAVFADIHGATGDNSINIIENNVVRNMISTLTIGQFFRIWTLDKVIYGGNKFTSVVYGSSITEIYILRDVNELFLDAKYASLYKNGTNASYPLSLGGATRIVVGTLPNTGASDSVRTNNLTLISKGSLNATYDTKVYARNAYGTFANKPSKDFIEVGYRYFCTDKQTTEGGLNGIEIIHKGNDVWVDALGRVIS